MADIEPDGAPAASAPLGPFSRAMYRLLRSLIYLVGKLVFRVTVVGSEKVPTDRPFVLAPVHRSNIDFALVSLVTRRRLRYMAKDSLWKNRLLGRFVEFNGGFAVRRGSADREALRICSAVLAQGEPLVMFPEGTRQSGPAVAELFDGPAYVACKAGVPIVPVGIGGSEAVMPKGSKFIRPKKLALVVGDPIEPPAPAEGARSTSRKAVKALTDELRDEVQRLFDEAQERVGHPNSPNSTH